MQKNKSYEMRLFGSNIALINLNDFIFIQVDKNSITKIGLKY